MINELVSSNFRHDGVNIVIKRGESYYNRATGQILQELPEDAVAAEWATVATKLRSDQTGAEYEIVHDVEGSTNTYTEVYLSPESYCATQVNTSTAGGMGSLTYIKTTCPSYSSYETYHEGDKVIYDKRTYICTEEEITGILPKLYGWDLVLPYPEMLDQIYIPYEELPQPEEA